MPVISQKLRGDLYELIEGFGVLMAAVIGVPLYACGGGMIPSVLAFVMTFSLVTGIFVNSAA